MDRISADLELRPQPMPSGAGAPVMVGVAALHHSYYFGEIESKVLQGIDIEIPQGEFVAVLGPSGCGKTTLLNLLGGLEKPARGDIHVNGRRINGLTPRQLGEYRRDTVSFIFQFYNLLPNLTASENIAAGLEVLKLSRKEIRDRTGHYLQAVGLEGMGDKFPAQLSGGMQQRVAIARALAKQSKLILADEPTGNLDQDTGRVIMDLVQRVHRDHSATIVLITHDQEVARRADRIYRLGNGRMAADPA